MPESTFLSPIQLPQAVRMGDHLTLDRHVTAALRFRQVNVKEAFTFQDAEGGWFRASLLAATRDSAEARVYERMPLSPEPAVEITLVCAVFARQRMLQVMQKATELGVSRIFPVFTERSVGPAGLDHEKAHAWPGQILRAVKQCRRGSVPDLRRSAPLADVLVSPEWEGAALRLALDERLPGTTPLAPGTQSVALAVGPEGGWSDPESAALQEAGAQPLSLGGRILRAETAVLVGLTLVEHGLAPPL